MSFARHPALILASALILGACGKSDTPSATSSATAGDSIGIAACDDYLAKYEACISDKVPADARAALKTGLDQTRDAWRSAISSGAAKSDLEAACKTMHDGAKTAMSAYGCSDF